MALPPWALPAQSLDPRVRDQIRALVAEKAARSPAQQKIASRLLHAERIRRGRPVAPGVPTLRTGVRWDGSGRTLVDVRAQVTPALIAFIEAQGGEVVNTFPAWSAVRARLPAEALEPLAARPEVQRIRPAERARVHKVDTSEGDVAHRADEVRALFGVDGTGITVGVISNGVDSLAAVQASGDLPAVTVLPGQAGSGTEGTAMLEIVHDLAPGANLMFATALGGQAAFAANIVALHAQGAHVIVDDVAYFAEPVFQDGVIADAVNTVTTAGALYFSSAGNEGNLDHGTAGVWEGDYQFSGSSFRGDPTHDFGAGDTNRITVDSPFVFTLQWSDPQGASGNDYDLFLLQPNGGQLAASSTDLQNGNDDAFEIIDSFSFNDANRRLVVVNDGGAPRFLHLNTVRGELASATAGQTSGHSAARAAFSIAAVRASQAGGAGGAFDGTESVESFSSDGPRRVFYEADGTPITPGNFGASGGEVRPKPDLTAANCVSTATPGFGFFCGTSASAPHAAAIAALLLELGGPPLAPEEVREAFETMALDIEAPGWDRDAGYGIIDAVAAADAIAVPESPFAATTAAGAALLVLLSRRRRRDRSRPTTSCE